MLFLANCIRVSLLVDVMSSHKLSTEGLIAMAG